MTKTVMQDSRVLNVRANEKFNMVAMVPRLDWRPNPGIRA